MSASDPKRTSLTRPDTMPCPEPRVEAMRRRDFIKGIAGLTSAWPLTALAQQSERGKRIGVLSNAPADAQGQSGVEAFQQALRQLSWSDGSNLHIDVRWGENDPDRARKYAAELMALAPDVL